MTPGQKLRRTRKHLDLPLSDIQAATSKLAALKRSSNFTVRAIDLSQFETDRAIPTVLQLYALAGIYKVAFRETLNWFGIDLAQEMDFPAISSTRKPELLQDVSAIEIPVELDPALNFTRTSELTRLIQRWGIVPLTFLKSLSEANFSYGYIGSDDYTMFPLLMPGAFVQIDESRDQLPSGGWQSDYERPIYFLETERGFICSWCALTEAGIIPEAHPLSPAAGDLMVDPPRQVRVVGQVVGVAMHLRSELAAKQAPETEQTRPF